MEVASHDKRHTFSQKLFLNFVWHSLLLALESLLLSLGFGQDVLRDKAGCLLEQVKRLCLTNVVALGAMVKLSICHDESLIRSIVLQHKQNTLVGA